MKKNYLALGGLLACLHVLFLLLSNVFFGSEIILLIFLPMISSLFTLKADKRSIVIFVIATIILCLVAHPINTFIYIIPALLVGVTYGSLRKVRVKELSLVYITSLVHMLSLIFTIFAFKLFFIEFDIIQVFENMLNVSSEVVYVVLINILIVLSLVQAFITHIVSDKELMRFNYKIEKEEATPRWFLYGFIISSVLFIVFLFLKPIVSSCFMLVTIMFILPYIIEGIIKFKYKKLTYILCIVTFFISIYLIALIDLIYLPLLVLFIFSPFIVNIYSKNIENNTSLKK